MNSGENIRNALQVLYKTYENVQKLMDYAKITAREVTDYQLMSPKALRWKSDNDPEGWLLNDFILLFQNSTDPDCESGNEWKAAPVYAMELFLGKKDSGDLPSIYLSKFEYDNINGWNEGCSPANHWVFYWPIRSGDKMNFSADGEYFIGVPKEEKVSLSYWGLKQVTFTRIDLMSVHSGNLKEKIFGTFDLLKEVC